MRKKIDNYNKFIDTDGYLYSENGKPYCRWVDNVGYYQSAFREDGKKHYVRLHRLIAKAFIPNPNGYPQVNHIDGNKLNNDVSNLEWTTNSQNTKHGYDNNLYHSKKRNHQITAMDKNSGEYREFRSIRECAEELNLNRKTITAILKNEKENNYSYDFKYKV